VLSETPNGLWAGADHDVDICYFEHTISKIMFMKCLYLTGSTWKLRWIFLINLVGTSINTNEKYLPHFEYSKTVSCRHNGDE
jgi:hypothetical protein